jgi:uncharacterized protein YebE (UPF0316 family)
MTVSWPTACSLFGLPLLPLFIFAAEVCVVTLSTMRTIFVARGMKFLAPCLGFFEVSIWLFAISEVMKNLNNPSCYVAFAGGFTLGNYLGILLEKRLALGSVSVHIITRRAATGLVGALRTADYGVTTLDAQGTTGPVQMVLTVVPRKELAHVIALVKGFDPHVFYAVDEVQAAAEGVPSLAPKRTRSLLPGLFRLQRAA